jgi:DNA end-binding protein Ku
VTQRKWCASCGREVLSAEIVKGFEFEKGRYVLLLEAELDAVQPMSTRVIELTQFALAAWLDPIHLDRSYYLAPDGAHAGEAFAVMSAAMVGLVGIGTLAIYGREYLVAVRAHQGTLLLHTLHHEAEIRPISAIDAVLERPPAPVDQVRVARQVIAACTRGRLDLSAFTDTYQADLQRLIDAKITGQEIVEPAVLPSMPTLSLHEALTQSLAAVSAAKKRQATAVPSAKRKRA